MVLIQAVAYSNVADASIYNRGVRKYKYVHTTGHDCMQNPHLSAKIAVVLKIYKHLFGTSFCTKIDMTLYEILRRPYPRNLSYRPGICVHSTMINRRVIRPPVMLCRILLLNGNSLLKFTELWRGFYILNVCVFGGGGNMSLL